MYPNEIHTHGWHSAGTHQFRHTVAKTVKYSHAAQDHSQSYAFPSRGLPCLCCVARAVTRWLGSVFCVLPCTCESTRGQDTHCSTGGHAVKEPTTTHPTSGTHLHNPRQSPQEGIMSEFSKTRADMYGKLKTVDSKETLQDNSIAW